jgi:hypothetical protein
MAKRKKGPERHNGRVRKESLRNKLTQGVPIPEDDSEKGASNGFEESIIHDQEFIGELEMGSRRMDEEAAFYLGGCHISKGRHDHPTLSMLNSLQ